MAYLKWISDSNLNEICTRIVDNFRTNTSDSVDFSNIVDPFSALFDVSLNNISFDEWMMNEKIRQRQKTLQNMIGTFHQNILGKVAGWQDMGVGEVVDLVCPEKKIIAEVKNKYNTVKGSDKIGIFENFAHALKYGYNGYTAYYVTIIAKKPIDKPFVPSDHSKKSKPAINENIREIDGASFYKIATGSETALVDLYSVLPHVFSGIIGIDADQITKNPWFSKLFELAIK